MPWFLILLVIASTVSSQQLFENDNCNNSRDWVCKKMRECSAAIEGLKRGQSPKLCGFSGNVPIVCCPPSPGSSSQGSSSQGSSSQGSSSQGSSQAPPTVATVVTQRPTRRPPTNGNRPVSISQIKCKEYARYVYKEEESPVLILKPVKTNVSTCAIEAVPLIVGGVSAKPREFPHMALVGYGNDRNRIQWACGGSLISEEFVMSAAHCSDTEIGTARWVKLGELVQDTDSDEADPVLLRIIQRIDHPQYNKARTYNDLSLFRLERKVELNPYVRPLCLPDSRTLPGSAIASGWGHIEWGGKGSKDLKKVRISLVSHANCSSRYKNTKSLPQGINEESQLCAWEEGKDTCQGDSGGPLQITLIEPYCMYMQIGVTSFGKACASGFPGVYTRLIHYTSWIESIVWPDQ